ncbi:Sulfate/thiosulfate import ATP-binding protein CysA [Azospirillaceae bacterium]
MAIDVSGIVKRFGSFLALDAVDLTIDKNEFVALLGPSGSGKTTLLRILGGLEHPDSGSLWIDGVSALEHGPRDRKVGFVFQHYSLFRHMTVFDNVAFGLRVRSRAQRPSKADIASRVHKLLRLVQLEMMATRYPSQLSGGQRQRVALARALAIEPKVLLLDEPFGALDAKVRKELRRWLRRLHDEMELTSVFVTHDQEEALELADRVAVMHQGRIIQIGAPDEVYSQPQTEFVYDFLGNVNRFECEVTDGVARRGSLRLENTEDGAKQRLSGAATAFVRPHDIALGQKILDRRGMDEGDARLALGQVTLVHPIGPTVRIEVECDGVLLEVVSDRDHVMNLGLRVGDFCPVKLLRGRVFPKR